GGLFDGDRVARVRGKAVDEEAAETDVGRDRRTPAVFERFHRQASPVARVHETPPRDTQEEVTRAVRGDWRAHMSLDPTSHDGRPLPRTGRSDRTACLTVATRGGSAPTKEIPSEKPDCLRRRAQRERGPALRRKPLRKHEGVAAGMCRG